MTFAVGKCLDSESEKHEQHNIILFVECYDVVRENLSDVTRTRASQEGYIFP